MRAVLIAFTLVLSSASPSTAQPVGDGADQTVQRMEANMAAARVQAARPGDDALSCDQIEAEMAATMNDPQVQGAIAANGAAAQAMQAQAGDAQRQAMGMMGAGVAGSIIGSFVPGFGYAQQAMMMAQNAGMRARAQQQQDQIMGMGANMDAIMPQLMRGERLYQMAEARQCPFVQNMSSPNAAPE